MKTKKGLLVSVLLAASMLFSACSSGSSQGSASADTVGAGGSSAASSATSAVEQNAGDTDASSAQGRLKMTLNGTDVVYAELNDTPAAAEFLEQLPFTIDMHEHMDRQKEVYLPFSLSEECQTNTVYEYEIGEIVYWHPGPTMGIFTEHDGRSISSGIEVLARMDDDGVEVFRSYDADVTVLFEYESTSASSASQGGRQLMITLDGTQVIYALLLDTPAANAFVEQLPLTLNMTDYADREKHAHLDFSISDDLLENIQYPYEIGDIIYYPPGPTFAMYYDHDGREISAGMEVIARLDEEGIATLATYPEAVQVTVELLVEEDGGSGTSASAQPAGEDAGSDTLVVYFSVPDSNDNSYVEIDGQQLGNTQYMAMVIAENTGGDIFRIEPVTPYPTNHEELLQAAQEEIRNNARPEIAGTVENFDSYDVVFVGYPNWNADMPYIMYTFFETYDFSGKTIVPFNTHGGSGFSGTIGTIASLEPNALMLEGKSISRNAIEGAEQEIIDWLEDIGMKE